VCLGGAGINAGWDGDYFGGYTEFGYKALFLDGGTVQVGANYTFGGGGWDGYARASAGIDLGPVVNIGASTSTNYNFTHDQWGGLNVGLNAGVGSSVMATGNVGYTFGGANDGFNWGLGVGYKNGSQDEPGWHMNSSLGYSSNGWDVTGSANYTQNPFVEYEEYKDVTVARAEPGEEGKYGHYWIEDGSESYGYWPNTSLSPENAILGVPRDVNGVTAFGGSSTRDPEHGKAKQSQKNKLLGPKGGKEDFNSQLKSHAQSYKNTTYAIPFGNSCHTFQKDFLRKNGYKIVEF
jgi:hypothetical protein